MCGLFANPREQIPKGFRHKAQGCKATLGMRRNRTTPKGLRLNLNE